MKKQKEKPLILPPKEEVTEFLLQSNLIEGVVGDEALEDAEKAWKYIWTYGLVEKKEYIDYRTIRHVHQLLMKRLNPRIAGKFRECDVWVGGSHKPFLGKEVLRSQLDQSLNAVRLSFGVPPSEEIAKNCHVDFEDVHPFEDGNGRVGRILYNWHRIHMGLPLHIIHAGEEQQEYYKWFRK